MPTIHGYMRRLRDLLTRSGRLGGRGIRTGRLPTGSGGILIRQLRETGTSSSQTTSSPYMPDCLSGTTQSLRGSLNSSNASLTERYGGELPDIDPLKQASWWIADLR